MYYFVLLTINASSLVWSLLMHRLYFGHYQCISFIFITINNAFLFCSPFMYHFYFDFYQYISFIWSQPKHCFILDTVNASFLFWTLSIHRCIYFGLYQCIVFISDTISASFCFGCHQCIVLLFQYQCIILSCSNRYIILLLAMHYFIGQRHCITCATLLSLILLLTAINALFKFGLYQCTRLFCSLFTNNFIAVPLHYLILVTINTSTYSCLYPNIILLFPPPMHQFLLWSLSIGHFVQVTVNASFMFGSLSMHQYIFASIDTKLCHYQFAILF